MGLALAQAAARRGAEVTLILGPSTQHIDHPAVSVIRVVSAAEMYQETLRHSADADVIILAAAVSDYTPVEVRERKMKRGTGPLRIELQPTRDIAAAVGSVKKSGQILVGFALETENEQVHARDKLKRKNLDIIVLNSLADEGSGFTHDTNRVTLIDREGKAQEHELKPKSEVAEDILDAVQGKMKKKGS